MVKKKQKVVIRFSMKSFLGIFICLECSGKHRGLGVHLSFVRSISMDYWKDNELQRMKVGGNRQAKEFFIKENVDSLNFIERYNSRAAALYRDKIRTESQGKTWSIENFVEENFPTSVVNENVPKISFEKEKKSTSFAGFSMIATKWATVAKQSAVHFSKSATNKASEITSKVTEQAKDGTLVTNVQGAVVNAASTVGNFGTKTWNDLQSFWSSTTASNNAKHSQRLDSESSLSDSVSLCC